VSKRVCVKEHLCGRLLSGKLGGVGACVVVVVVVGAGVQTGGCSGNHTAELVFPAVVLSMPMQFIVADPVMIMPGKHWKTTVSPTFDCHGTIGLVGALLAYVT